MRFNSALILGSLAIVASAADKTSGDKPSQTYSMDPFQVSVEACVHKCTPGDVGCLSQCNPVPNPNNDQVSKTHNCIAKCDQGNGSKAETQAYAQCAAACVKAYYYDPGQGTPQATGASDSDNGSDDSSNTTEANATATDDSSDSSETGTTVKPKKSSDATETSGDDSSSETGTNGAASTTDSGKDDAATGLVASSAALFGAIAAVLAL